MVYINTEELILECSYTEPIDDGHPDIGSYTTTDFYIIKPYRLFNISDTGDVIWHNITGNLGVSMHPGILHIESNLLSEIGKNLYSISTSDYTLLCEYRTQIEDVLAELEGLQEQLNLQEELKDSLLDETCRMGTQLTQEVYEQVSKVLCDSAFKSLRIRILIEEKCSNLRILRSHFQYFLNSICFLRHNSV